MVLTLCKGPEDCLVRIVLHDTGLEFVIEGLFCKGLALIRTL